MKDKSLDHGLIEDMMDIEAADCVESITKMSLEDLSPAMQNALLTDEFIAYHIKETDGSIHEVIVRRIN